MFPTLRDSFLYFTGIDVPFFQVVQSYGLLVALSFIVAVYILNLELKRKEQEGLLGVIKKKILEGKPASSQELITSGVSGFIIGFKLIGIIVSYDIFIQNPQEFILSLEGSFFGGIGIGGISAYLKYREKEKTKLATPLWKEANIHPYELSGNIVVLAAIFGLLGAKLFHNLENIDELLADPIGSLFSFSGLTFYGGLIVAAIAILIYGRKNNIHWTHMTDANAPGLILAYGIGRLGCHISGDGCWGIANTMTKPNWLSFLPDWMWAYNYPHNVINEGVRISSCIGNHCHALPVPVFPTSIYEFLMSVVIFIILWVYRKKITIPGLLFFIYLIFNGIERFIIEQIRVNTTYNFGEMGITQAQIISTSLILIGIGGIWYVLKNKDKLKQIKA